MATLEIKTHAKCILAGEHAVLRGHPGIVWPVQTKTLHLTYESATHPAQVEVDSPNAETLLIFFWKALEDVCQLLEKDARQLTGNFTIKNNIPIGFGMGFSSALCAALARWALWCGEITEKQLFQFAKKLEDNFHGKSSGIDIAGAIADYPIRYSIKTGRKKLILKWKPHLYITPSEFGCSTEKCIKQVESLWKADEMLANTIDQTMHDCVLLIEKSLAMDEHEGFNHLASALNKARSCFENWQLVTPELKKHIDVLFAHGAKAVKPTGSGAGGYVLSLWEQPINHEFKFEKISLFE